MSASLVFVPWSLCLQVDDGTGQRMAEQLRESNITKIHDVEIHPAQDLAGADQARVLRAGLQLVSARPCAHVRPIGWAVSAEDVQANTDMSQ